LVKQTKISHINFSPEELHQLNIDYTHLLGNIIKEFISKNKLKNLDAVCSHGHTILHQPKMALHFRLEIFLKLPKLWSKMFVILEFRM
jgi:anhydro-N-acetylmuramic acid kinase